jgi:hypothetical protein
MRFLEAADRLRIMVFIMPPHSTHRLQPLDVGLFGPLSTAYSDELDKLQHNGWSLVSMTKRLFYMLFREAWKIAFIEEHINNAFQKTGIWPYNPEIVISPLRKLVINITSLNAVQTPLTCRAVRRIHR